MSSPLPLEPAAAWPEVKSLAAGLSAQLDLYESLEGALHVLGDAVRRRDVAAVGRAVDDQQSLLGRLSSVAAESHGGLQRLAARLDLPRAAKLEDVVSRLVHVGLPHWAAELAGIAHRIRQASQACGTWNAQNGALLRQALAYTNFTLRMLTTAGTTVAGYTGTGAQQPSLRRLVDTHA